MFYTQPKQSLYPRVGVLWKCGAAPSENVGITDIRGILSYLILWENYRYWNQSFSRCWLVPHKLWFDFVQRSEMWLAISMVRRSWSPLYNQHVWGCTLHKKNRSIHQTKRIATSFHCHHHYLYCGCDYDRYSSPQQDRTVKSSSQLCGLFRSWFSRPIWGC